jgi:hypothetical protein
MRDATFLRKIAQESLRLAKVADQLTARALTALANVHEAEAQALDYAEGKVVGRGRPN